MLTKITEMKPYGFDAKKRLLLAESYPLPKMTKNTLETIFKENF
jgi:hypothetical protein